jgi:hypothetical protein
VQLGLDNGEAYASYATGNGFHTSTRSVTVVGKTATNQAATATNQNATASNNEATASNKNASTGITETEAAGDGAPITVNAMPAYYTVIYIKKMA